MNAQIVLRECLHIEPLWGGLELVLALPTAGLNAFSPECLPGAAYLLQK